MQRTQCSTWPARIRASLKPRALARRAVDLVTGGRASGRKGQLLAYGICAASTLVVVVLLFIPGIWASLGCLAAAIVASSWFVRVVHSDYLKGFERGQAPSTSLDRGQVASRSPIVLVVSADNWPPSRWLSSDNPALRN
jgi:hypothetical protein